MSQLQGKLRAVDHPDDDERHAKQVLHMREQHSNYRRKVEIYSRVSSSHSKMNEPTAVLTGSSSGISMEEREEEEGWRRRPSTISADLDEHVDSRRHV